MCIETKNSIGLLQEFCFYLSFLKEALPGLSSLLSWQKLTCFYVSPISKNKQEKDKLCSSFCPQNNLSPSPLQIKTNLL